MRGQGGKERREGEEGRRGGKERREGEEGRRGGKEREVKSGEMMKERVESERQRNVEER